ncbi:hypothetical protein ABPG72_004791 [Tetrahymena utriculariae]
MSTIANTLKSATLRMSSMSSINCGSGRNFVTPAINMMINSESTANQTKYDNSQFLNNGNNNGSGHFKFNTYTQPFERTPFVNTNYLN